MTTDENETFKQMQLLLKIRKIIQILDKSKEYKQEQILMSHETWYVTSVLLIYSVVLLLQYDFCIF